MGVAVGAFIFYFICNYIFYIFEAYMIFIIRNIKYINFYFEIKISMEGKVSI